MNEQTYNQKLTTHLGSKHPTMLLPVRLETRYVRVGTLENSTVEMVDDVLILSDKSEVPFQQTGDPSGVFKLGQKLIEKAQAVHKKLMNLSPNEFGEPAIYKISILESRVSNYAKKACQSLEGSIEQQSYNYLHILEEIKKPFPSRLQPEASSKNSIQKQIITKASEKIEDLVKYKDAIGTLSASGLLKRQILILHELNKYRSGQKIWREVNEEDYKFIESKNNRLTRNVKEWNKASLSTIEKHKSLPEILGKRFEKLSDLLSSFQSKIINSNGFEDLSTVCKEIDTFHIQKKDNLNLVTSENRVKELARVKESLEKINTVISKIGINILNPILLSQLSEANAKQKIENNITRDLLEREEKEFQDLRIQLEKRRNELEKLMDLEDCQDGERINPKFIQEIFKIKSLLSERIEQLIQNKNFSSSIVFMTITSIIHQIERLIVMLNSTSKINCDDCRDIEILIQNLPGQLEITMNWLDKHLSQSITLKTELENLMDEVEQKSQILKECCYKSNLYILWDNISVIKSILNQIFKSNQVIPDIPFSSQLLSDIEKRLENLLAVPLESEFLTTELKNGLSEVWGGIEALNIIPLQYNANINDTEKEIKKAGVVANLLETFFSTKKITNCESSVFEKNEKLIIHLENRIESAIITLEKIETNKIYFIRQFNDQLVDLVKNLILQINQFDRIDGEDLQKLHNQFNSVNKAIERWKRKIKSAKRFGKNQLETLHKQLKNLSSLKSKLEMLYGDDNKRPYLLRKELEKIGLVNNIVDVLSTENPMETYKFTIPILKTISSYLPDIQDIVIDEKNTILGKLNEFQKKFPSCSISRNNVQKILNSIKLIEEQFTTVRNWIEKNEGSTGHETIVFQFKVNILNLEGSMTDIILCGMNLVNLGTKLEFLLHSFSDLHESLKKQSSLSSISIARIKFMIDSNYSTFKEWKIETESHLESILESCKKQTEKLNELKNLVNSTRKAVSRLQSVNNSMDRQSSKVFDLIKKKSKELQRKIPFNYSIIPGDWELWIRVYPSVIAIDAQDQSLTSEEIEAGKRYWKGIWNDQNNRELKFGYWRSMTNSFGSERSAFIIKTMKPEEKPATGEHGAGNGFTRNFGEEISTESNTVLNFPKPAVKAYSWNKVPVSRVMPDGFVFALYETDDSPPSFHFGSETIPEELVTGIDPNDENVLDENTNGDLIVGPDLKWTVDFSDALSKGMAVRIPLGSSTPGFSKIIALGIKTKSPDDKTLIEHSKELIEELFEAHHYGANGLSFVPPGTPTNNTSDTDSGYDAFLEDEESFRTEVNGDTFTVSNIQEEKADGQILAEALGVNPSVFQNIYNADGFTIRNAGIMNFALWQATGGYYFEEMYSFYQSGDHMFNTDTAKDSHDMDENLDRLRDYFVDFVKGRGALPSIRVGDQPYGMLPIGVFHQTKYLFDEEYDNNSANGNGNSLIRSIFYDTQDNEYDSDLIDPYGGLQEWNDNKYSKLFCQNLLNVLLGLKAKWIEASKKHFETVDDIWDDSLDAQQKLERSNERFMKILGLHPNPVSFESRYGLGTADESLLKDIFSDGITNFHEKLGYSYFIDFQGWERYHVNPFRDLFFPSRAAYFNNGGGGGPGTLRDKLSLSSLKWLWTKNSTNVDDYYDPYNPSGFTSYLDKQDNSGAFLSMAHLRFLDKSNKLNGQTVDELKISENRPLSKLKDSTNQNYIDWLQSSSIKKILKASIEGTMPSRSMLFLLLSNSIIGYAFDAAMKIYRNMGDPNVQGTPPSGIKLSEAIFKNLPKRIFFNWNFIGQEWWEMQNHLSSQTYKQQAVNILNFVINIETLKNEIGGWQNYEYGFGLDSQNKLVFRRHDGGGFWTPISIANNLVLSNYCHDRNVDRRSYKSFSFQWSDDFIDAVKNGAYRYNNWNANFDDVGSGNIISSDPSEIASSIISEEISGIGREWSFFLESQINKNDSQDPNLWTLNPDAKAIEYTAKMANSRLPYLLYKLKPSDVPDINADQINIFLDNSMADYLKRSSTLFSNYAAETNALKKMNSCLGILSSLPTAELERLMSEHVSMFGYGVTPWFLSLINRALWIIRSGLPTDNTTSEGSYIGAYGLVLNLEKGSSRTLVNGDSIIVDSIDDNPRDIVAIDGDNQGFIHAPSINHAITAAVMRSGYMATGGLENSAFEINLSSGRVKKALWLMDGIRNGQPLGALLGYQLERNLHERKMDKYIFDLRNLFPLVSDILINNGSDLNETVEANNVVDGLKLLDFLRKGNLTQEWHDFESMLEAASETSIMNEVIDQLEDCLDAVSDLALTESTFQVTRGNFAKASAIQKSMNEGKYIPEPEVVKTPRTGHPFTQRVGICLSGHIPSGFVSKWKSQPTPRALAEPILNKWIGEQIGDPEKIGMVIKYEVETDVGNEKLLNISLDKLGIQPIDLVFMINTSVIDQESEISRFITAKVVKIVDHEIPNSIYIDLESGGSVEVPFCSIIPMLQNIFRIITGGEFLQPEHLVHHGMIDDGVNNTGKINLTELISRVEQIYLMLGDSGLKGDLEMKKIELENDISGAAEKLKDALIYSSLFGIPEAIPHFTTEVSDKDVVLNRASSVIQIIEKRLDNYSVKFSEIDNGWNEVPFAKEYLELVRGLLGGNFIILPLFKLINPREFSHSIKDSHLILPKNDPLAMETWLARMGRIRENIGHFENFILNADFLRDYDSDEIRLKPVQLPYRPNDHSVMEELPENYFEDHDQDTTPVSLDKLSLAFLFDTSFDIIEGWNITTGSTETFADEFAGIVVGEFTEVIPGKEETTGIAFHYDQPNAEAPQSILLSIPPANKPYSLKYFVDTVNTALELAKLRAIEPEHLNEGMDIYLNPFFKLSYTPADYSPGRFFFSHPLPAIVARVTDFSKEMDHASDFTINNLDNDPDSTLFPFGEFPDDSTIIDSPSNPVGGNQV